jgi:plastocyanin
MLQVIRTLTRNPRVRVVTTVFAAVLLLGANEVAATADATTRTAKPATPSITSTNRVKIVDFAFKPKAISVSKGTKVKWVNKGAVSHTSTSNSGLWNSGVIAPGGTFSHVFKKAGTFKYHCTIHPTMVGKVVVG